MKIENQAVMFALLCKHTLQVKGEAGRAVIQTGMIRYGRERGRRMAARAKANGDPIALWTNLAYGEWTVDYPGQMTFGATRTEPTYRSEITRCAWCDAWRKYGLLEYGREYCVNVDKAVYEGFDERFVCTPDVPAMSWGGERCAFDWGQPLSDKDQRKLEAKKKELGTSAMRDFGYHTAHIYFTISRTLQEAYPEDADVIIDRAAAEYKRIFGDASYAQILTYAGEAF